MRITRRQLRKLINEQINLLTEEAILTEKDLIDKMKINKEYTGEITGKNITVTDDNLDGTIKIPTGLTMPKSGKVSLKKEMTQIRANKAERMYSDLVEKHGKLYNLAIVFRGHNGGHLFSLGDRTAYNESGEALN